MQSFLFRHCRALFLLIAFSPTVLFAGSNCGYFSNTSNYHKAASPTTMCDIWHKDVNHPQSFLYIVSDKSTPPAGVPGYYECEDWSTNSYWGDYWENTDDRSQWPWGALIQWTRVLETSCPADNDVLIGKNLGCSSCNAPQLAESSTFVGNR